MGLGGAHTGHPGDLLHHPGLVLLYEPEVGALSIAAFFPVLVLLILLSVLASAVFPEAIPPEGVDLKAYYADNARFVWTIFAMALIWLTGMDVARLSEMGLRCSPFS